MKVLDLNERLRKAADYLEEHPWCTGSQRQEKTGAVDVIGALRFCEEKADGHFYMVRALLREDGRAETWNDRPGRTKAEVVTLLRAYEVTADRLAGFYGPQWCSVQEVLTAVADSENGAKLKELVSAWCQRPIGPWGFAAQQAYERAVMSFRTIGWHNAGTTALAALDEVPWSIRLDATEGPEEEGPERSVQRWQEARQAVRYTAYAASAGDLLEPAMLHCITRPWKDVYGWYPEEQE